MSKKIHGYRFTVRGVLSFPLDMLRYDACWPEDQRSVAQMAESFRAHGEPIPKEPFEVMLVSAHVVPPTVDRWASFLWRVVKVEPLRG